MAVIIDRRVGTGKNHVNRQRFLDRAREQIKDIVKRSINGKNLKDIGNNEKVRIRNKDVSEPEFHHDRKTGDHKRVLPGNKQFQEGDTQEKPRQNSGDGSEPGDGEGLDEFEFTLTRDEFLSYLFDDLELPDFVKETMKVTDTTKYSKAGFTNSGSPANLSIVRTFKNSIGRRLALSRPSDEVLEELEIELKCAESGGNTDLAADLREQLEQLKSRRKVVPFIDEHDLRYNYYEVKPNPSSQAVMFCLMDVSGSMGEKEKDISKRFFLLLYLFLEKKYDKIDVVFVRHTDVAEEVDEQTFFYDTKSGGTLISSGLTLIQDTIRTRYNPEDWNIYIAQCTDGDNQTSDNPVCEALITDYLQKVVQYYAYIQIDSGRQMSFTASMAAMGYPYSAWPVYDRLSKAFTNIECRRISAQDQIWTVFRSLFEKVS